MSSAHYIYDMELTKHCSKTKALTKLLGSRKRAYLPLSFLLVFDMLLSIGCFTA